MHCEVGERLFLFDLIYLQIPPSGNVSRKQNQRALVAPTGGNDIRDTQYPGSTTQRERQRDTRVFLGDSQSGDARWHCYGVSNFTHN